MKKMKKPDAIFTPHTNVRNYLQIASTLNNTYLENHQAGRTSSNKPLKNTTITTATTPENIFTSSYIPKSSNALKLIGVGTALGVGGGYAVYDTLKNQERRKLQKIYKNVLTSDFGFYKMMDTIKQYPFSDEFQNLYTTKNTTKNSMFIEKIKSSLNKINSIEFKNTDIVNDNEYNTTMHRIAINSDALKVFLLQVYRLKYNRLNYCKVVQFEQYFEYLKDIYILNTFFSQFTQLSLIFNDSSVRFHGLFFHDKQRAEQLIKDDNIKFILKYLERIGLILVGETYRSLSKCAWVGNVEENKEENQKDSMID
jgi:hypothetical protein